MYVTYDADMIQRLTASTRTAFVAVFNEYSIKRAYNTKNIFRSCFNSTVLRQVKWIGLLE